jgi:hypothetical protein
MYCSVLRNISNASESVKHADESSIPSNPESRGEIRQFHVLLLVDTNLVISSYNLVILA